MVSPLVDPALYEPGWNVISLNWWLPVWLRHIIPELPTDFPVWTDYWISIPLAVVITLVRLFISDPIATRIVVSKLNLSPTSLRDRNDQETSQKKRIPKWVLNEIDGFAQDMLILKKRLKKKKLTALQIRYEKQQRWKAFCAQVIADSAGKEGGPVTQAQMNAWWGVIKSDSARTLELMKFNEAFWRFAFYTFIWVYGIWVGLRESWLTDMRAIWAGWPLEQTFSTEVRWYYFLSMGHYIHLFVTQFFEPKRKDWWEMFIHHIVTMLLLFFSYLVGFIRIGVIVLLCHDGSDIFLELAKLFNYLKLSTLCDVTFSVFAVAFFVGRLVMYPWRVVYVAVVLGAEQCGIWRGFYIFVGLLLVLQVLHLFWFYTIASMVYSFVATGNVEKDVREETESEAEETTGEYSKKLEDKDQAAAQEQADRETERQAKSAKKAAALLGDEAEEDVQRAGQEIKQRAGRRDRDEAAAASSRVTRSRSRGKDRR